jgi:hypothetical protein
MPDLTTPTEPDRVNAPLSWRDVFRAVGESEVRIVQTIKDTVGPVAAQAADHEARLRVIENSGSPDAKEAMRRVQIMEQQVTPLAVLATERDRRLTNVEVQSATNSSEIANFTAREKGVFATLGVGKSILLVGIGLAGVLFTALDLISRIAQ